MSQARPRRKLASACAAMLLTSCLASQVANGSTDYRACAPVRDVFQGTRYEGSDLYRVRARVVSCRTARRVARNGTELAVAEAPDATGRVVVSYRNWTVFDDLRGPVDRFVAKAKGGKRVRWLFGDI
jgi:hypothetical protein